MSAAEPTGTERRMAAYRTQRGQRPGHLAVALTPKQWRRVIHKERRHYRSFGYPNTKGHATPRQRRRVNRG